MPYANHLKLFNYYNKKPPPLKFKISSKPTAETSSSSYLNQLSIRENKIKFNELPVLCIQAT